MKTATTRLDLRAAISCVFAAFTLVTPRGHSQVVSDGATNTLNNVTNIVAGDVTVGTNGSFTLLILTNGALLTNGGNAYIGRNAGANSNTVWLTGTNTRWLVTSNLIIGSNGSFNRLVISNGALVGNSNGFIGSGAGANSNLVVVTGSNSFWSNRNDLSVGFSGSGNQLVVSDGALVGNRAGNIGQQSGSSNNLVTVTGAGSYWSNRSTLFVGNADSGNQMVVSNGGLVTSLSGIIGNSGSGNNAVLVTGTNSYWSNQFQVRVGLSGSGNRLVIEAGGQVADDISGYIGASSGTSNNEVTVSGAGSLWSNRGDLRVGESSRGNQLIVSNGGTVFSGTYGFIGGASASNLVLVTGAGSIWTNQLDLFLGNNGSNNLLVVSNGGLVVNSNGVIGANAFGTANLVVVTGTNSVWSNRGDLRIGADGVGNRLIVGNGGTVFTAGNGVLGFNSGANSNTALMADAGSQWQISGTLFVGSNGAFNRLVITNGAMVKNGEGYLGYNSTSSNNVAVVTGAGSKWTNLSLYVGYSGAGNQLVVSNGGVVRSLISSYLGDISTSSNNVAVVTGTDSLWTNDIFLYVGYNGAGNQLVVSNGGVVANGNNGSLGLNSNSRSNVAVVTDAGSLWNNQGDLYVGDSGAGNQLVVSNGGVVRNNFGFLGGTSTGSNNFAVVTGAGSLWTNQGDFVVGVSGAANQLVVSNGGVVMVNSSGYVGQGATGNNNVAVVTGAGSLWTNRLEFYVGLSGAGNRLVVSNGGTVVARNLMVLGANPNSINNRIVVDGGTLRASNGTGTGKLDLRRGTNVLNSGLVDVDQVVLTNPAGVFEFNGGTLLTRGGIISNGAPFVVGASGSTPAVWDVRAGVSNVVLGNLLILGSNVSGSQLLITNGASLTHSGGIGAFHAYLGFTTNSTSNVATVAGGGSLWNLASNDLIVGNVSSGNRLVVSNGGAVRSSNGLVGHAGSGNLAVVTGAGSLWSNRSTLFVGSNGGANLLVVSNAGIVVADGHGLIGINSGANANTVSITDPGSRWSVTSNLYVGNSGSGNRLVVSNGAAVFSGEGDIGFNSGANNNAAVVTGSNSLWRNANGTVLRVGRGGSFNQLVVSNGASVFNSLGSIGTLAGANSNVAVVTGVGSLWSNSFNLRVGDAGSFNQMMISNGAAVFSVEGDIGFDFGASNNAVAVTGSNSLWNNSSSLTVGRNSSSNQLVVSNGATVLSIGSDIGFGSTANNNVVLVTGSNSVWRNSPNGTALRVGRSGSFNQLVVSNGAMALLDFGSVGATVGASNNVAVVTGVGSFWSNRTDLRIGDDGDGNRLVITDAGTVFASGGVFLGFNPASTDNRITTDGGSLIVSNGTGTGVFDIRRGTNRFNAGLIDVDQLLLTNAQGVFEFNGGTLRTKGTTNDNGRVFTVGNGASAATLQLLGGLHAFSNNLVISSNAALAGNGMIVGTVTNFGTVSAGSSAGSLCINGDLRLQSSSMLTFELGGLIPTNQYDQITVTNFVELAGTLSLSLINSFYPEPTNTFTLLSFASSSGTFTNAPFAGRVSTVSNLASFAVTYTTTNVVIGGVQYTDSDGDGQTDIEELAAGTSPTNSSSALSITSITVDFLNRNVVQFQTVSGKSYRAEYSNDLVSWITVSGATFTSAGFDAHGNELTQWIDDGTLTGGLPPVKRFYRVGLQ